MNGINMGAIDLSTSIQVVATCESTAASRRPSAARQTPGSKSECVDSCKIYFSLSYSLSLSLLGRFSMPKWS
jgi:hypothetical protein